MKSYREAEGDYAECKNIKPAVSSVFFLAVYIYVHRLAGLNVFNIVAW